MVTIIIIIMIIIIIITIIIIIIIMIIIIIIAISNYTIIAVLSMYRIKFNSTCTENWLNIKSSSKPEGFILIGRQS